MGYHDIREFISVLEAHGKLRHVKKEVDPSWEIAGMARWVYQGFPEERRFALVFDNVKDSSIPVATALIGASREVYALALGTTPEKIHEVWLQALRHTIPPRLVRSGPCQEVVIGREKVDLSALPVPTWTPGKDMRPCITAVVITKNHDTGVQNMGTYRCQVQSKDTVTLNTMPGRQAYQNYESYARHGKPAPLAVAIACEPVVHLATSAALPKGIDELHLAGALKGAAVATVRAMTVDLQVPANAEIIVEGELQPSKTMQEDSFGEFAGYMGPGGQKPFFQVASMTHRSNPIYYGYISQFPPSESTMIQGNANECMVHKLLVDDFGETTVVDVAINQTHGGNLGHAVVQMTPIYPQHAMHVGRLVAELTRFKMITIVDCDIDIRDRQHLDWAWNSRVNPARDTLVIEKVFVPNDPAADRGITSKLIIDATHKGTFPDLSLPAKEVMLRAYESWQEADLPAFNLPSRVERLLDFHAQRMQGQT
ncbi:MAG: UbiD family decarboxylase [Candidatus Tectomicrobia bacterium]|nr:UbiD family decarboxylase [Candidatus Tectomicrobia bacterium]